MLRIIIVDSRKNFIENVSTRALLSDSDSIEIVAGLGERDITNLHRSISAHQPDLIAICENVLDAGEDWDFADTKIVGYALTQDGVKAFEKHQIPCYGMIKNSAHLLNLLNGPIPSLYKEEKHEVEAKKPVEAEPLSEIKEPTVDSSESSIREKNTSTFQLSELVTEKEANTETVEAKEEPSAAKAASVGNIREFRFRNTADYEDTRTRLEKELSSSVRKTVVVAVYAAKGGVGKTTISSNLAAYLALTSHGRGKNQVCIVDYNIDFGNVRETLGFSNDGPDMSTWAAEIQERLNDGEKKEDIQYGKYEVREFLQVMDQTGLFGLCAPLTHTESMDISKDSLEIMMENIIHNGDFDFVVFDTGNNTRDSSYLALEQANFVFLVATQDVTTASCNKSAIEALQKMNFDMNKTWLVLNNELPTKYADGISARDVEDYFSQYLVHPCVARIKNDWDILQSNNAGKPIVCYQTGHPFTQEIGKIVAVLTGRNTVPDAPKSSLSRFIGKFKRKKR